jgi:hypothetical protein
MATTIEALVAAVQMDGASQKEFLKVCARFGLQHKLLDPPERLWIHSPVESSLELPDGFFIGRHLKLQHVIFTTQLKRSSTWEKEREKEKEKEQFGLWRYANYFWRCTKRLWPPPVKKNLNNKNRFGQDPQKTQPGLVPQPSLNAEPLTEKAHSQTMGTTKPPPDVATNEAEVLNEAKVLNEAEVLGEGPPGLSEDEGQAVAPEQTADRKDLADEDEAMISAYFPAPSKPTPESAPDSSSTDADVTSIEEWEQKVKDLGKEAKILRQAAQKLSEKKMKTRVEKKELIKLLQRRQLILDKRSQMLQPGYKESLA